jgi:hypothetical protein
MLDFHPWREGPEGPKGPFANAYRFFSTLWRSSFFFFLLLSSSFFFLFLVTGLIHSRVRMEKVLQVLRKAAWGGREKWRISAKKPFFTLEEGDDACAK